MIYRDGVFIRANVRGGGRTKGRLGMWGQCYVSSIVIFTYTILEEKSLLLHSILVRKTAGTQVLDGTKENCELECLRNVPTRTVSNTASIDTSLTNV